MFYLGRRLILTVCVFVFVKSVTRNTGEYRLFLGEWEKDDS